MRPPCRSQKNVRAGSGFPGVEWGSRFRTVFSLITFEVISNDPPSDGAVSNPIALLLVASTDFGFGVQSDCVFTSTRAFVGSGSPIFGTGCNLTTGWQVNASYEHYWTPQFHESFFGGITEFRYNSQANAILCTAEGAGTFTRGAVPVLLTGSNSLAAPGCNNNFDIWSAGTRLQYDFTKTLYFGVEFLYQHLDSASLPGNALTLANTTALLPANNDLACTGNSGPTQVAGRSPCGNIKDMNNLAVTARIHKDFLP